MHVKTVGHSVIKRSIPIHFLLSTPATTAVIKTLKRELDGFQAIKAPINRLLREGIRQVDPSWLSSLPIVILVWGNSRALVLQFTLSPLIIPLKSSRFNLVTNIPHGSFEVHSMKERTLALS